MERRLPFSLRPYNFRDEASGPQLFAGLDLRLDYAGNWTLAKFRDMINMKMSWGLWQ